MAYHEINRNFETGTGEITGRKRGRNTARPAKTPLRAEQRPAREGRRPVRRSTDKAVETPAADINIHKKPAVERTVAERPAVERTVAERPAVERPAVERSAVEKTAVERPAAEKSAVKKTLVEMSVGKKPEQAAENAALDTKFGVPQRAVSVREIEVPLEDVMDITTNVIQDEAKAAAAEQEKAEMTGTGIAEQETAVMAGKGTAEQETAEMAGAGTENQGTAAMEHAEQEKAEVTAASGNLQVEGSDAEDDLVQESESTEKVYVQAGASIAEEKKSLDAADDEEDEDDDEPRRRGKGGILAALLILIVIELAAAYAGGYLFFRNHFYPNTYVNEINVGMMDIARANLLLNKSDAKEYYSLNAADGSSRILDFSGLNITRNHHNDLSACIAGQQPLTWPLQLAGDKFVQSQGDTTSYDTAALSAMIQPLLEEGAAPQNACIAAAMDQHGYVVVKEQPGTMLDEEGFTAILDDHIRRGDRQINLAEVDCFRQPEITADNEELIAEAARLNALDRFDAAINIGAGDALILRGEKLSDVLADSRGAAKLAEELGDMLDTVSENEERPYYTFDGKKVVIKSGYGWKLNREETAESIQHMLDAVNNAMEAQLGKYPEPQVLETLEEGYYLIDKMDGAYTMPASLGALATGMKLTEWDERYGCFATASWEQEAASHRGRDIGENYAEVDITAQTVRLFQEGQLVLETPCVTGLERKADRATPAGIFAVFGKTRNKVLTGYNPDGSISYQSPVSYWMPFNKNIGFHDASWRGSFGGSIYLNSGSHGCVNLPVRMAEKLFSIIQKKWTVVVYRT